MTVRPSGRLLDLWSESSLLQKTAAQLTSGNLKDLLEKISEAFADVSSDLISLLNIENQVRVPDEFIISPVAVEDPLPQINLKKAIGPDGLPNWFLEDFTHLFWLAHCLLLLTVV